MEKKNYHIIINPASRSGMGYHIWRRQIQPTLCEKQISYTAHFSRQAGDVALLVRHITREHFHTTNAQFPLRLIILGGDGTVNEALQAIEDFDRVLLGYIPTGSSNDLARDLKIPQNPLKALDVILAEKNIHPMDIGVLTYEDGSKRRFAVSCGIGFDAAVCEESMHSRAKAFLNKIKLGKLTYLCIALKQLFAAKAVSCRLALDDGEPIDIKTVLFVTVMQHKYEGGGFQFCPTAQDDDGILDICAVGDIPKLLVLFALPTAFFGKHYFVKGITPYRARTIRIETSLPLWLHTDGEVSRRCNAATVTGEPRKLRILL